MRTLSDTSGTTSVLGDTGIDAAKILGGLAAGALLMYLLDPDRGAARRARGAQAVRDLGGRTTDALGNVWHGAGERLGMAADTVRDTASNLAGKADDASGSALSRLGKAAGGLIDDTLARSKDLADRTGDAIEDAGSDLRAQTRRLVLSDRAGWTAQLRNPAIMGGGLLAATGLLRRSPLGWALGLAGAVLLARGIARQPLRDMLAARGLHTPLDRTVDLEKSIHIDASPEEVYDLWTNYENFPRFMSHVIEVRDLGRRRSHWVVRGPGGSEYAWNSVLTEQSRPHRLAWRSEPGAEIPQSGSIQLEANRGGTDVTVRMSYTPPAGALGHGLAMLLGSDPKAKMDEDLARMKAYIERGVVPPDAAQSRAGSRYLH